MTDLLRRFGRWVAGLPRRFANAAWWVHVLATLAVVAVVVAAGAATLGALYLDYTVEHRALVRGVPTQSEPPAEERLDLAQRFAPILRYHSKELFVPISIAGYVSRTELRETEGKFTRTLRERLAAADLPILEGTCLRVRGCLVFLDIRGAEPDPPKHSQAAYDRIENQLFREGVQPTVYAHVTRYDDTGDYAIQYWFLYFFNFRLNEHESDWEQVTIRLDSDKNPVDVFYSAHEGGHARAWDKVQKEGEHPIVFPALGSHANYFTAGRHPVSVVCKRVIGSLKRCIRGRELLVDVADGAGRELRVGGEGYELVEFSEPVFIGSYGTGNYVILTRQPSVLGDPRTRTVWRDPLRPFD